MALPIGVALRRATPDDTPFLRELFFELRAPIFAIMPPEHREMLLEMQWRARESGYASQAPDAVTSIVTLDEVPIGAVILDSGADAVRIVDITLLAAHRGQGFGTAILLSIVEEAEGKAVDLTVEMTNPAQRLYARLGFVVGTDNGVFLSMTRKGC